MGKNSKAKKREEREMQKKQVAMELEVSRRGCFMTTTKEDSVPDLNDPSKADDMIDDVTSAEFKEAAYKLVQCWADECFGDENPTDEVAKDELNIPPVEKWEVSLDSTNDDNVYGIKTVDDTGEQSSYDRMFNFRELLCHFKDIENIKHKTPKENFLTQRHSELKYNTTEAQKSNKDLNQRDRSHTRLEEGCDSRMFTFSNLKSLWSE